MNNGVNITEKEVVYNGIKVWFSKEVITNVLSYNLLTNTGQVVLNLVAYLFIFYYVNNKE